VAKILLESHMWDHLLQYKIISAQYKAKIEVRHVSLLHNCAFPCAFQLGHTEDEQISLLLDYLAEKRPRADFVRFCDCLRATGQKHIADLLRFPSLADDGRLKKHTRFCQY
jgi:hypothetical protein